MPLPATFAETLLSLSLASFAKVHTEPPGLQNVLSIKETNFLYIAISSKAFEDYYCVPC